MKKNKRNGIKHLLALMLFGMVLSMGMVCLADVQGTVIAKSAVIRASADPNSERLASVPSGKTIDIIGKTTGTDGKTWYQVYVNSDTKGYIRGDLLKVPDGASIPTAQGGTAAPTQSTDVPATTATPVDARQVTVKSNNTNIRKEASTSSESMAKANRGMLLTVVGEATGTDGKKWYQVTFSYNNEEKSGYIRSDLVTTDNVPNDPATSQIVGEENPGEEQPPETTPEEQPAEQPAEPSQAESDKITIMDVDEVPYIMPGFELATLRDGDQEHKGYMNGDFYIFYAQKSNGEEGWYLFDLPNKVYQRYVYTADGVTVPGGIGSVGLIPVIVLVVIIVILVAVVGLLLLKLKGQGGSSYKRYRSYDDDDDDQDDDDIDDLEDLEDDEEPQPVRRPQGSQPVRRPQGGAAGNAPQGQPPRRPQGQQPPRYQQGQQPPRRSPQGGPSNGNAPQGQQPVRRPQGGNASGSSGARSQGSQPPRRPQGNPGGQPARRPQPQGDNRVPNEKGQAKKGYKAKNLLEDEDMDFMDIE